ncbi:MAG: hypothetical protein AB7G28_09330 [Pirellulales bacterium]
MLRIVVIVALIGFAVYAWRIWQRGRRRMEVERATADFLRQKLKLQDDFRAAANVTGIPRGLRWKSCEFFDPFRLARDKANGALVGLVGLTIAFEAIEGGGMEDVEAVGNLRAATAVFSWSGFDWTTNGKAIFNLEPDQVLERYANDLTPVKA